MGEAQTDGGWTRGRCMVDGRDTAWDGPVVLLTNDDGVQARGITQLAASLVAADIGVVMVAPARDQSACGMRLTLRQPLAFERREDLAQRIRDMAGVEATAAAIGDEHAIPPVAVFSLDGTPCDCMILALDGGLARWAPNLRPRLVVSGVNQGPNLSIDVLHSGTVSAAREAAMYGLPAMAASMSTMNGAPVDDAVRATISLVRHALDHLPAEPPDLLRPDGVLGRPWVGQSAHATAGYPHLASASGTKVGDGHADGEHGLLQEDAAGAEDALHVALEGAGALTAETAYEVLHEAWLHGDIIVNVNVPEGWNGEWRTTRLGTRWYRNVLSLGTTPEGVEAYEIGSATIDDEATLAGDIDAVHAGFASVTTFPTWPASHPFQISGALVRWARAAGEHGWPAWLDR